MSGSALAAGLVPDRVEKAIQELKEALQGTDNERVQTCQKALLEIMQAASQEMYAAADSLEFERAAELRDKILTLQGKATDFVKPQASRRPYKTRRKGRRKQPWE